MKLSRELRIRFCVVQLACNGPSTATERVHMCASARKITARADGKYAMAIARSLARRPTHSYRRSREVCSRCVRWSHRSSLEASDFEDLAAHMHSTAHFFQPTRWALTLDFIVGCSCSHPHATARNDGRRDARAAACRRCGRTPLPGLRRDDTLTHAHPHRTAPVTSEGAWMGSQQRVSVRHTEGSRSIRTMGHGRHRSG
jgi:hypothetical protein